MTGGSSLHHARIAGLPLAALEPFRHPRLEALLDDLHHHRPVVEARKKSLADALYDAVSTAPPEDRRTLLRLRRDAFNDRSLRWVTGPTAKAVTDRLDSGVRHLLRLALDADDAARDLEAAVARAVDAARERERQALRAALDDTDFVRGVALAAPDLAGALDRLRSDRSKKRGRRVRRAEASLLRYLSRAAVKLSPFSTLTPVSLAEVTDDPAASPMPEATHGASRSLVRCRRFFVEQVIDLLLRDDAFRRSLPLVWNDTVTAAEDGAVRYLRPARWNLDEETGEYAVETDSWIRVPRERLPLSFEAITLRREPMSWDLLSAACAEAGGEAEVRRWADLGLLLVAPPWAANTPHLEGRLADHLATLTDEPTLAPVHEALTELVAAQADYADADRPAAAVRRLHAAVDGVWEAAVTASGVAKATAHHPNCLYEDVLALPPESRDAPVRVSRRALNDVLADVTPWLGLNGAFRPCRDFRLALAEWMRRQGLEGRDVALLDLFRAAQPLWRRFREFLDEDVAAAEPRTFDPFGEPIAGRLAAARKTLWETYGRLVTEHPDGVWIDPAALHGCMESAEQVVGPRPGAALFLQALDRSGRRWVVNRASEGTGRFGSRFGALLDRDTGERYRSQWLDRDETLLDVTRPQGDTLDVHAAQTQRVLAVPGMPWDVPEERQVRLRDLRVRLEVGNEMPVLTDRAGRVLQPAHLGGSGHGYVTALHRFLAQLGPGELKAWLPPLPHVTENGITHRPRLTLGRTVLARARWTFLPEDLDADLSAVTGPDTDDARAPEALDAWRRRSGLPMRFFLHEKVGTALGTYVRRKPQYIDLTSPALAAVFRAALAEKGERVVIEEALPDPAAQNGDRHRHALELLVETRLLGADEGSPDFPVSDRNLSDSPLSMSDYERLTSRETSTDRVHEDPLA